MDTAVVGCCHVVGVSGGDLLWGPPATHRLNEKCFRALCPLCPFLRATFSRITVLIGPNNTFCVGTPYCRAKQKLREKIVFLDVVPASFALDCSASYTENHKVIQIFCLYFLFFKVSFCNQNTIVNTRLYQTLFLSINNIYQYTVSTVHLREIFISLLSYRQRSACAAVSDNQVLSFTTFG